MGDSPACSARLRTNPTSRLWARTFAVTLAVVSAVAPPPSATAADGDPDPGFGPFGDSWFTLPLPPLVVGRSRGIAVQPLADGRILVLAEYAAANATWADALLLYRLLPDGSLDPSFGADGIAVIQLSPVQANALAVLPTGEILIGLTWQYLPTPGFNDFMIGRRLPDGAIDLGWGSDGWARVGFPSVGQDSRLHDLAVGEEGTVVAVGETYSAPDESTATFARLTPSGALDPTFGAGGRSFADLGAAGAQRSQTRPLAVLAEPGGSSVVFSGEVESYHPDTGTDWSSLHGRLVDGYFDPTFNATGYRLDPFAIFGSPLFFQSLVSVLRFADGSYVAVGNYRTYPALEDRSILVRVLPNGALDTSWGFFGYSGFAFDLGEDYNLTRRCLLDAAQRVVCLGEVGDALPHQLALARIEGPLFDPRFGTGGTRLFNWVDREVPSDLAIDSNGRILVVGTSNAPNPTERAAISRRLGGLPFTDGFESGLLEAWSATAP